MDTVPFGSFRRDLVEQIGPFDESLLTNEDYEFNTRVRRAGTLFMGEHNHPALGDYVAGPGPLNVWDFVRLTGFAAMAPGDAAEWSVIAEVLARAEGRSAVAEALALRKSAEC